MNIYCRAIRKTRFLWSYFRSLFIGRLRKSRYQNISRFLIFIGYPRSGHSLIAALLDAHPNTLISMEWGALSHLKMGYRKLQIYYSIERISRIFTEKLMNVWTGYSYRVEGQFQGRSDQIMVIGDKLAGQTSLLLMEEPDILDSLIKEVGELRILHVIRNPYDTIATMAKRSIEKSGTSGMLPDLDGFSERYFDRVRVINELKMKDRFQILDLYHEDFISDPGGGLQAIMDFLGLEFNQDYIEACSAIVFESPHFSRKQYEWPDEVISKIQTKINCFDFLSRYRFED